MPEGDHWHPRISRKKVFNMSFTQALPRRERSHNITDFLHTDRPAGIKTFYNTQIKDTNVREYSVEDRMQRKKKMDQYELRRTFFLEEKSRLEKSLYG